MFFLRVHVNCLMPFADEIERDLLTPREVGFLLLLRVWHIQSSYVECDIEERTASILCVWLDTLVQ